MKVFSNIEQQNSNKTHHNNHTNHTNHTNISNNSSPATPKPEVNNNTVVSNSTQVVVETPQPTQNTTVETPVVVVENNKTEQESNNTNTTATPESPVVETNKTQEENNNTTITIEAPKTTTEEEPKENITTSSPIGIEKTETPQMTVSNECSNQIKDSFAIIYNMGIHAAAQNIEKVKRDYENLKNITNILNKACDKSFSINMKPIALFMNSGVCSIELEEIKKLAMSYSQNSSKDMIYFTQAIQGFWYRYENFMSSCFVQPKEEPKKNTTTSAPIGIEKTELPQMEASDECSNEVKRSFAIIYDLGVHAFSKNVDKVKRDYEILKNITINLNKACTKSFSIMMKPKVSPVNNSGVCGIELEGIMNVAMRYSENSSKDLIYFAKTIQGFWYRYENFISSCASRPVEEPKVLKPSQEQLEANCLMAFAEVSGAVHKMSGPFTKTMINNLHNKISNINKYCDAKFSMNLENSQNHAGQGNCQKTQSLMKVAVEKFVNQESRELDSLSQTIRQISYIGKQIINDC